MRIRSSRGGGQLEGVSVDLSEVADSLHCMSAAQPTIVVKTLPVVVHQGGSDMLTTVIAVAGLVLAVAALVWQTWSFRVSGSRVSVTIREGLIDAPGTQAVTAPDGATPSHLQSMRRQGFTNQVLAVEVMNSGRSPTNVKSVSVRYENGAAFTLTRVQPSMPFRLDAESDQTRYYDRGQITAYAQAMVQVLKSAPLHVQGQASVGGRKKPILSKSHIAL